MHGISGGREARGPKSVSRSESVTARAPSPATRSVGSPRDGGVTYRTQPVTAADLCAGQIRIPVSTPTKALFPDEKVDLQIVLRGRSATVGWDPRSGPDRERSGVLRFRGIDKSELLGDNRWPGLGAETAEYDQTPPGVWKGFGGLAGQ